MNLKSVELLKIKAQERTYETYRKKSNRSGLLLNDPEKLLNDLRQIKLGLKPIWWKNRFWVLIGSIQLNLVQLAE